MRNIFPYKKNALQKPLVSIVVEANALHNHLQNGYINDDLFFPSLEILL